MSVTRKYTVDRIVSGKIVLLEREDESVQIVVDVNNFAQVEEGDIVQVTWTDKIGGASYTVKCQNETKTTKDRVRGKLNSLLRR